MDFERAPPGGEAHSQVAAVLADRGDAGDTRSGNQQAHAGVPPAKRSQPLQRLRARQRQLGPGHDRIDSFHA